MFGVLDEYKVLQHEQVFIQYSSDMQNPGEKLKIVEGIFYFINDFTQQTAAFELNF